MNHYPIPKTDKHRQEGILSLSEDQLRILRGEVGTVLPMRKKTKYVKPKWKDLDMRTVDEVARDFWRRREDGSN